LLAKVYINLIDQKEPTLNFQNQTNQNENKVYEKILYFKKIIKPTENEIKNHKSYLKNDLKKNNFS
jgi:DNA polymerase-3 subunit epsilon